MTEYGKVVIAFGKRGGWAILAADGGCTCLLEVLGESRALAVINGYYNGRIMVWEGYVTVPGPEIDLCVDGRWRSAHPEEVQAFLESDSVSVLSLRVAFAPTVEHAKEKQAVSDLRPAFPVCLPAGSLVRRRVAAEAMRSVEHDAVHSAPDRSDGRHPEGTGLGGAGSSACGPRDQPDDG